MERRLFKDTQYTKFSFYGFLKNLRFFDPYLLLFFLANGLDYFHIGILFSIREIATNILEIPSGFAADLFGRRRAMMSSFVLYIFSFLLFYFSSDFIYFAVAITVFAGGEAFRTGTHKAMILDYLKRNGMEGQKVHYYGGTRAWSQRGSALSALIAGALVFVSGSYRPVFIFTLIPYIFGFFLMVSYPRYLDFSIENAGKDRRKSGGAMELFRGILKTLKDPVARRGFLHASFSSAVFKTVKDYIQPMIRSIALALPFFAGMAEAQRVSLVAGGIYFVIYLLTASASVRAGKMEERFSSRSRALNAGYIILIPVIGIVAVCVGTPVAAVGLVVFVGLYLLENLRRPMTVGYLSSVVQGRSMATGLSVESQLKTVLVAVLSPIFGYIADGFGLSAAMGSLAILTLILYPFLRIHSK